MLCFIDDEATEDADYEEERSRALGVTNRGGFVRDLDGEFGDGSGTLKSFGKNVSGTKA
jgi:hypothetical protein